MENGYPVLLGHYESDLNERVSLALFLVVAITSEITFPAIKIRVGDIVNNTFGFDSKIFLDPLENVLLPVRHLIRFQGIQGTDQPLFSQVSELKNETEVRSLVPVFHLVQTLVVQAVGIHHRQDLSRVFAEDFWKSDTHRNRMKNHQWPKELYRFHLGF